MTKIAYIRASQHNPSLQFNQACMPGSPIKSGPVQSPSMMSRPVFFQPPMPGAQPQIAFTQPSQIQSQPQPQGRPVPKPMMMTPTTRFNSNPTVILTAAESGPGGRISKPLMEKRRRARINQCLSQLKKIVVDSAGQYTQGNKCKLEKADILELTVKYVEKLHLNSTSGPESSPVSASESYITGYSDCIRQVCEFITEMPELPAQASGILKQSLQSHLSQCLCTITSQSEVSGSESSTTSSADPTPLSPPSSSNSSSPVAFPSFCTPPSPAPSSAESNLSLNSAHSPQAQIPILNLKRNYSFDEEDEDEEEYEDISDEEFVFDHPINLSKMPRLGENEDESMWRPW